MRRMSTRFIPLENLGIMEMTSRKVAVRFLDMNRQSRWWIKLGLLCASLLLCEGAARLYVAYLATPEARRKFSVYEDLPQLERRVTPHPYLCYVNTPGYRRGERSHNQLGWRGAEIPIEKAASEFRLVTLGGSTTYTEGVGDDAQTYPALLQNHLHEVGRTHIRVINAGVPGYNSWESLINLCFRVLELEPDLVMVHHGANDVHCRLVESGHYRPDNRGRRRAWAFPRLSWPERHCTLIRLFKRWNQSSHIGLEPFVDASTYIGPYSRYDEAYFNKLLDEHPPVHFRNNLRNIAAVCAEHEVVLVLATWAWCDQFAGDYAGFAFYQRGFKEMNDVVRELASEKGLPLYDFRHEMSNDRRYWRDGRHVNEAGSLLKAQLFAEYLLSSNLLDEANAP